MQFFLVVGRSAVTRTVRARGVVTFPNGAEAEALVLPPAEDWKQQQGLLEAGF